MPSNAGMEKSETITSGENSRSARENVSDSASTLEWKIEIHANARVGRWARRTNWTTMVEPGFSTTSPMGSVIRILDLV